LVDGEINSIRTQRLSSRAASERSEEVRRSVSSRLILIEASYARLVKCAKESAGKRHGTSGKKIGNVHLKWAFSEASVLFLRANPKGQRWVEKLSAKHGKAKALTTLWR